MDFTKILYKRKDDGKLLYSSLPLNLSEYSRGNMHTMIVYGTRASELTHTGTIEQYCKVPSLCSLGRQIEGPRFTKLTKNNISFAPTYYAGPDCEIDAMESIDILDMIIRDVDDRIPTEDRMHELELLQEKRHLKGSDNSASRREAFLLKTIEDEIIRLKPDIPISTDAIRETIHHIKEAGPSELYYKGNIRI